MTSDSTDAARVRIPPPLVFLSACVLGIVAERYVFPLLPSTLTLAPSPRLGVTLGLGTLGIVLIATAFGLFTRTNQKPAPWTTTPEIIFTGIYAWTRNPMYLGMALIQAAIGVGTASGWVLLLVSVSVGVVYLTAIRHEEVYLEAKFGKVYLDYKRSVRRWL